MALDAGHGDSHIHIVRRWTVARDYSRNMAEILRRLRSKAVATDGYISVVVWQAASDPNQILTIDNWQSQEQWNSFEKDPEVSVLLKAAAWLLVLPLETKLFFDSRE